MAELVRECWVLYNTTNQMWRRNRPGAYTPKFKDARLFTRRSSATLAKSENEVVVSANIVCNLEAAITRILGA